MYLPPGGYDVLKYLIFIFLHYFLTGVIYVKSLIFVYESMAEWEAAPISFLLSKLGKLDTFGFEIKSVTGYCGLKLIPEFTTGQIDVNEYDVLVIPGGIPANYAGREELFEIIRKFDCQGKFIGAICAGPVALHWAGVLKGRKFTTSVEKGSVEGFDFENYVDEYSVVDGNIITGKGEGFTEFAVSFGDALKIFTEETKKQFIELFRHP